MVKGFGRMTVVALVTATLVTGAYADSTPKFKADVPESITTPDSVKTEYLGELNFVDGFPTDETVVKTYDFLDTSRAVELFLNATCLFYLYLIGNLHTQRSIICPYEP